MFLKHKTLDVFTHIIHELGLTLGYLQRLIAVAEESIKGCHSLPRFPPTPELVVASLLQKICLQLQSAHAWSIEHVIAPIHSILKRLVIHRSLDGIVQLVNVIALD